MAATLVISVPWAYCPEKRRLSPEDEFFEDGDIECSLLLKQLTTEFDREDFLHTSFTEFECNIYGCHQKFNLLQNYEAHYITCHRHTCSNCRRGFPSNHLLELHVLESHDSHFSLMSQKKPMYRCLVESCFEMFADGKTRKNHLINIHKYPANFRFEHIIKIKRNPASTSKVSSSIQSMDVDSSTSEQKPRQFSKKVPKHICFGQGSVRAFKRPATGKCKNNKKDSTQALNMEVLAMVLE